MAATHLHPVGTEHYAGPTITLGDYSYSVVPQRVGRLKRHLGRAFADIQDLSFNDVASFVDESLERAHRILAVFIPDMMPVWEFCGYGSRSAYEGSDDSDDDGDFGPTVPEIVGAFEVVMRVNRFDLLGHLKALVPEELLRAQMASMVANNLLESGPTSNSPSSSATPGADTPSTTSGTTPPTKGPKEG